MSKAYNSNAVNMTEAMIEVNEAIYEELKGTKVVLEINDFLTLPLVTGQFISFNFTIAKQGWTIRLYPKGLSNTNFLSMYVQNNALETPVCSSLAALSMNVGENVLIEYGNKKAMCVVNGSWLFPEFLETSKVVESIQSSSSDKTVRIVCTFCCLEKPRNETVTCQTGISSVEEQALCHITSNLKTAASQTKTADGKKQTLCHGIPKKERACQAENTEDCSIRILNQDLQNLYINKELCDVKFKVGSTEFLAHRAILAARSPVFSSMFKHEMTEKNEGVINICDCDPESFEDFLEFLYTGKAKDTGTNNLSLYKMADMYSLGDLKEQSVERLSKGLTVESVCDVLVLSAVYEEIELLKTATDFLIRNAEKVFDTEMWRNFMVEKPLLAGDILVKMAKDVKLKQEH